MTERHIDWVAADLLPSRLDPETFDPIGGLERGQERAKIPLKYRQFRMQNVEWHKDGEDLGKFMRRVKAGGTKLGLHAGNKKLWETLCRWRKGAPWLVLSGTLGSGKTCFAAAIANGLLQASGVKVVRPIEGVSYPAPKSKKSGSYTLSRHVRMGRETAATAGLLWTSEADLVEKEEGKWGASKDTKEPLKRYAWASVLVIDDVGVMTDPKMAKSTQSRAVKVMNQVLTFRYERGLPTILTTNLGGGMVSTDDRWKEFENRYGERLRSRVEEKCKGWMAVLDTVDLRRV